MILGNKDNKDFIKIDKVMNITKILTIEMALPVKGINKIIIIKEEQI